MDFDITTGSDGKLNKYPPPPPLYFAYKSDTCNDMCNNIQTKFKIGFFCCTPAHAWKMATSSFGILSTFVVCVDLFQIETWNSQNGDAEIYG